MCGSSVDMLWLIGRDILVHWWTCGGSYWWTFVAHWWTCGGSFVNMRRLISGHVWLIGGHVVAQWWTFGGSPYENVFRV